MLGYRLLVFHKGSAGPTEAIEERRAAEVLDLIQSLLAKHPDCHRIRVESASGSLFAVDCNGDTVTD
ncbi:hypothetical protein KKHFBJBL_00932 [Brevundimonas sp. NIBR11]|nr:hypothetical protein KKHFBJBL_00932 [Brevundimonas sp. NIBR11]